MASTTPTFHTETRSDWVRLRTLLYLRWMAVSGQSVAVLLASQVMGFDLRLDLCALAIGASVTFNIVAHLIHPANKRLNELSVMLTLLFDLTQLAVLLYLTGGLANPFSMLMLAPVTISATALTLSATVLVGIAAVIMISVLAVVSIPLTRMDGTILAPDEIFLAGTWAALVIAMVFLASYARRITVESFSMSQALTATQMALAREQQLTALGGVVAAAAHEMGTPLATIKLVASELDEELQERPDLLEDVGLIRSQAERCRDILRDMGRSGRDDALVRFAPFSAIVTEAAEPHLDRGIAVIMRADGAPLDTPEADEPDCPRQPEIIHGVRNLVQNAVDFASNTVWIDMSWDARSIVLTIGDDGAGFPADLMARIGDPFLRARGRWVVNDRDRPGYEGMGLGLFIAKTLLERSGATLSFSNGAAEDATEDANDTPPDFAKPTGAIVDVIWPRAIIETTKDAVRGPLGRNQLNLP